VFSRSLTRTTTFRLTAAFAGVFAAAILLLLGMIYLQTSQILSRRVDHILTVEASALDGTSPGVIVQVIQDEASRDPLSSFALISSGGEHIAGDPRLKLSDVPIDDTPHDLPAAHDQRPRRALAQRLPWGEVLIVARDTSQLIDFKNVILSALIWSGALICVSGMLLAFVLSLGPLKRVRETQRASQAIAAGDLAMRLPINGSGDELDELAGIVNVMMDEVERLVTQARTVGEGVAHELRTPMTRLRATLEHVATMFQADDVRSAMLDTCIAETDSLLTRFRALLRIAAVESRGRQSAVDWMSLSAAVEQVVELYEPLALDKGLRFESIIAPNVSLRADAALIFEALSNLVDNAIKFTSTGGLVQVTLQQSVDGLVVEVKDTGIGIAADEQLLVTKRFYRSQNAARYPGHGLGLSLVAAVAELHDFTLVISDGAPGAVFKLICRATPRVISAFKTSP
jgi:signal transduction histidine kinase